MNTNTSLSQRNDEFWSQGEGSNKGLFTIVPYLSDEG